MEARESGKQADRVTTVYSYMGRQTRYTDIHKVQTRLTHTDTQNKQTLNRLEGKQTNR